MKVLGAGGCWVGWAGRRRWCRRKETDSGCGREPSARSWHWVWVQAVCVLHMPHRIVE